MSGRVQRAKAPPKSPKNGLSAGRIRADAPHHQQGGDTRSRRLLTVLVAGLSTIIVLSVLLRAVLEPALVADDLPVATLALVNFASVLWLNRTRFHQAAAFLFCLAPVWLNLVEGLLRPDGPVWYALLPMAAILGAAFLRFRSALLMALLGVASAGIVVYVQSEVFTASQATLIVMSVGLMNTAALGMAVFRATVERARRAEVERLAGQLAATERLESIGRLAGGIAHDFNNLLTVIISSAELARRGELDALEHVMSASQRAASLTRQLLAFSHHRGGQRVSVAVDDAIDKVRPLLRRLLPENIELSIQTGSAASVLLEDQQLEQVLFNLCANARDAMPDGGRLTIRTSRESGSGGGASDASGDFVVIEISDDGVGMDESTQAHVFEPFFTTKPIGQGTGLGLATVHGIARQAGGWLDLESAPHQGTLVRFALPVVAPQAALPRRVDSSAPAFSGWVLLVEDEPIVRRSISRLLEVLGFSVLAAGTPDEATEVLASAATPPALLITDVVMPGRSGVHLATEIRSTFPELPVLLMSGYADEDLRELLCQHATHFLAKPFTKATLVEALATLLAQTLSPGEASRMPARSGHDAAPPATPSRSAAT